MNFIVGLGNPGAEYAVTKHNVGFRVVDQLVELLAKEKMIDSSVFAQTPKFFGETLKTPLAMFVKPNTYMNESGKAVRAVMQFFHELPDGNEQELKQLFVVHDDLDIELGKYKIQFGTGPKIHNGLRSLYQHLHTEQFWHVRVGIDGRQGDRSMPGSAYVLAPFSKGESEVLENTIREVAKKLQEIVDSGS